MADDGTYRVLPGAGDGPVRLLDRETYEPVTVARDGHDTTLDDLRPGNLLEATLDWSKAKPTVESASVRRETLYTFGDSVEPMFELAEQVWQETKASGDAMNARETKNTDGAINGVLYVFAESGERGRFEEFRDGSRPLEPLVDRVNEGGSSDPREVFVLRPTSGEFTAVTITLSKGGQFADTIRDTYDLPRPGESSG